MSNKKNSLFSYFQKRDSADESLGLKEILVRGSLGNLVLKVSGTIIGFISSIILARNLELSDFGLFAYIITLVSFLSLPATAGVPSLIVRETSKAMADSDWGKVRGLWRWGWAVIGSFSLLVIVLAASAAYFFSDHFEPYELEVFYMALLLIPLFALGGMRSGALRGLRHVVLGELPDQLIRPVIFVIFLIATIYIISTFSLSPLVAVSLQLVALLISFVIGSMILWSVTPVQLKSKPSPVYEVGGWFRSLLPLALISGMVPLIQYTDILMLGFFETVDKVALYRVALSASLLAAFGLHSAAAAMAPHMAHIHHQGDQSRLQNVVSKSTKAIVALSLAVVSFLIVFGEELLGYFYGETYIPAYQPLAILLVGQFVNSLTGPAGMLLNMTGNESVTASILVRSVIVNVILNLVFIPIWGMNGAALATVLTVVIRGFMQRMLVKRTLGIEVFILFNLR